MHTSQQFHSTQSRQARSTPSCYICFGRSVSSHAPTPNARHGTRRTRATYSYPRETIEFLFALTVRTHRTGLVHSYQLLHMHASGAECQCHVPRDIPLAHTRPNKENACPHGDDLPPYVAHTNRESRSPLRCADLHPSLHMRGRMYTIDGAGGEDPEGTFRLNLPLITRSLPQRPPQRPRRGGRR